MDNIPNGMTLDPDTYGIIVNNKTDKPDESEKQIAQVESPFTVKVTLSPSELIRFDRVADDFGLSRADMIQKLCRESIAAVGRSTISAPSFCNGEKVTAPKYNVERVDSGRQ